MGAGRPPTPSAMRELSGSHPERLNKREARFRRPDAVKMPKRVEALSEAKELWEEIVPELVDNGLLNKANQSLLADICVVHARLMDAYDDLESRGRTLSESVFNRQGEETGAREKPNPAIAQIIQLVTAKQRMMSEFGMTPASATKVAADPPDDRDAGFGAFQTSADEEDREAKPC